MTIKLADRLVSLRKEKGYSQEVLAEKLGLSRQAISKWERAEATPDSDNLIALAEIYGLTLDELLDTGENKDRAEEKEAPVKKTLLPVQIIGRKMFLSLPFVVFGIIILYAVGGFIFGGVWWKSLWLLFFIIPIVATVATALRAGKTKRLLYMLMTIPVGITTVMIYIMSGMFLHLWAKAWVLFFIIPIYAYVAFLATGKKRKNN